MALGFSYFGRGCRKGGAAVFLVPPRDAGKHPSADEHVARTVGDVSQKVDAPAAAAMTACHVRPASRGDFLPMSGKLAPRWGSPLPPNRGVPVPHMTQGLAYVPRTSLLGSADDFLTLA